MIGNSPGGSPHENRQPFVVVNYIMATVGVYPSQP
jgi:microcystin-dependent protein